MSWYKKPLHKSCTAYIKDRVHRESLSPEQESTLQTLLEEELPKCTEEESIGRTQNLHENRRSDQTKVLSSNGQIEATVSL